MNILDSLKLGFVASLLCSASFCLASEGVGSHGGVAVVCTEGQHRSVQLLDFYETQNEPKFEPGLSVKAYKELALNRLNFSPDYVWDISRQQKYFDSHQVLMPMDYPSSGDFLVTDALPPGCRYENIIAWGNDGQIRINYSLLHELPNIEQAAIELHEAVYAVGREKAHAVFSDRTRQLVAKVFAKETNGSVLRQIAGATLRGNSGSVVLNLRSLLDGENSLPVSLRISSEQNDAEAKRLGWFLSLETDSGYGIENAVRIGKGQPFEWQIAASPKRAIQRAFSEVSRIYVRGDSTVLIEVTCGERVVYQKLFYVSQLMQSKWVTIDVLP